MIHARRAWGLVIRATCEALCMPEPSLVWHDALGRLDARYARWDGGKVGAADALSETATINPPVVGPRRVAWHNLGVPDILPFHLDLSGRIGSPRSSVVVCEVQVS